MTECYDWNPMPHVVDIRCPDCGDCAHFEFAELVRIPRRRDVPYFQKSKLFEYRRFRDGCGHDWHAAVFHHRLHGRSVSVIRDLPPGYAPADWEHSRHLLRSHGLDLGTAACSSCGLLRKHQLAWPREAYFQLSYRGECLWTFHRESVLELRRYIASTTRRAMSFRWTSFLRHVPAPFLAANARRGLVE